MNQKNGLKFLPRNRLTIGQKAADALTKFCGSWTFIVILSLMIVVWVYVNIAMIIYKWDPYPFIMLNLTLSCIAALEAPIILMSQNRAAERDRLQSRYDYYINRKAERKIEELHNKIDKLHKIINRLKLKET